MKKKLILLPLVGLFLYVTLSSYYYGPAYGGLGDLSGATGTTGCSCHNGSPTSSTVVTVQLLNGSTPVTSYVPGNTYTLKISATNTGSTSLPNFGFQMSVVNLSGAGTGSATYAGTMGTAPAGTHVYTTSGVQIFEHYNASHGDGSIGATTGTGGSGSTYVETIPWTAPSSGTGSVVIYGVVNPVNHDLAADAFDLWNSAAPVTICELPAAISGGLSVCAGGGTSTLTDVTSGGTFSSGGIFAAVGSSGSVTGISTGTQTVNYTTSCGSVSATLTVNSLPTGISGVNVVCSGATTTLTDITTGGTWSSVSPSVASVAGSGTTGVVTGVAVAGGTSQIKYTLGTGCSVATTVTVNPAPGTITGVTSLCQGATSTLTCTPGSGTWSSSVPGVATIGASSGLLTAIVTGSTSPATTVITYTSSGCSTSTIVTVNPLPAAISGTASVCAGHTVTLSDGGSGSWTSGTPSVATIGVSSGLVTGVATAGGTSLITYSLPSTGCSVTETVTVNPAPSAISGTLTICPGGTTNLTDGGSGTWTSASPAIATIGSSSGTATGLSSVGGTSVITYALPVTGCSTTAVLTVNPAPGPVTGTASVCVGATTSLTETGSGTWSSSNPGVGTIDVVSGLLGGISGGTTVVSYALVGTGCFTTTVATVNATPAVSSITGTLNVCVGATTTLSDGTSGGVWASSNPAAASVGSTGIVTGAAAGNATITYTVTSLAGCTAFATAPVTVNANPIAISGPASVCIGLTISLSEPISGAWSSNIPGIASITTPGSSATLTGVSFGTALITYTAPGTGCTASATISVNPNPGSITGPTSVCTGATTTLNATPAGGTWSSSTTHATIGTSSGIVSGATSGTSVISYLLGTGCSTSKTITVNVTPGAISGPSQVCTGAAITLTGSGSGTWSSSNADATVGSGTGVVTGASAGTPVISYTLATGCFATTPITVNALPSGIAGPSSVCAGQTISLTDPSGTSAWSSSNSSIASVGSGTGIVTGAGPGTATITFTLPATGCKVTVPVTVNPSTPVLGLSSLCAGATATLTDATPGGTWASTLTSVATIGTSGFVTAIGTGATTISYTLPSGCFATSTVNVISAPSAISGPSAFCLGTPASLTDAGGGSWTSSAPGVATVGSLSGLVTPATTGSTTVTYSLGTGCTVSSTITVNSVPGAISGSSTLCAASTVTLTDPTTPGGTWTASNSNATVGGTTGVVSGVTAGTTVLTYTGPNGCINTKTETINPLPSPVFGTLTVCVGATTTLTNDSSGGIWTSLPTTTATVGATSGIVTGAGAGSATVKYTLTATGCNTSAVVTVNPSPGAISPLLGTSAICVGATTTLVSTGAGTWSSSNANAAVGTTGTVTGITAGTSIISYTNGSGCFATLTVTINPLPNSITGTPTVCAGSTVTLGETSAGGSWSTASPAVAAAGGIGGPVIVSGITAGTSVIAYTFTATGCKQAVTLTVNALPGTISGATGVCMGNTSTLTDGGGGSWASSFPGTATIGSSSGLVTPVAVGITTITYTLSTGCLRTIPLTVNPLPSPISGADSVCTGATVTLTDGGGGTWGSSATATATAGPTSGIITGVSTGTAVISYTLATGCLATVTVTVHSSPSVITGTTNVCVGSTTVLADGTAGGAWSSGATSVATIGTTGIVSGLSSGTSTITYLAADGCIASAAVTVNPLPAAISGTAVVCPLANITLTDGGSGTWSITGTTIATVGPSTGIVTGVSAGTTSVTYTLPTGCWVSELVTVNPLPFAGGITGPSIVCADSTITLADTVAGGTWSSEFTSIANVSVSGIVTGSSAGIDTIEYAVTNSCGTATALQPITVNPLPVAGTVAGPSALCIGSSTTLTDPVSGGTWSSSNTSVATVVAATGVVTPVIPGTTTLTYSVTNGCGTATASQADTVIALIVAGVTGTDSVCQGDTINLSDVTAAGAWSVSNGNASVGSTGQVIGVSPGTDSVTYTITNTCGSISASLLVNVRSTAICDAGVKSIPAMQGITVYPNPSTGMFTVALPETPADATIIITDVLGKIIETRTLTGTQPQNVVFDLGRVAAGSYLIRVNAGTVTFRDKIVIW